MAGERLDIMVDRDMAKDIAAMTQRVAMDALREEVGRGFDHEPVVVTDGMPRRDPRQVKPYGKIEFISRTNAVEAAQWVEAQIYRLAPVLTGFYRGSTIRMINGEQVQNLKQYKPGDRIQIVATAAYSKKLEGRPPGSRRIKGSKSREKTKGVRGASSQAPAGIFRVAQRLAVARYGRSLFIDFKYVALNTNVTFKDKAGKQRARVYPAILIYVKPS